MDLKGQTNFEITLVDVLDMINSIAQQQLNSIIIFFVHLHYQIFTAFEWHFFGQAESIFLFE